MIARLTGALVSKGFPTIVLDVGGIGFELLVPMTTLDRLPALGEPCSLYTTLLLRNESLLMAGFVTAAERSIFLALLTVSGVGPRIALALLSTLGTEGVTAAVAGGDARRLSAVPGVGKKLSERLVLELRDKLSAVAADLDHGVVVTPQMELSHRLAGALTALEALGFRSREVEPILKRLEGGPAASSLESLIRATLRELGPR